MHLQTHNCVLFNLKTKLIQHCGQYHKLIQHHSICPHQPPTYTSSFFHHQVTKFYTTYTVEQTHLYTHRPTNMHDPVMSCAKQDGGRWKWVLVSASVLSFRVATLAIPSDSNYRRWVSPWRERPTSWHEVREYHLSCTPGAIICQ
jgi:hypothetical protein